MVSESPSSCFVVGPEGLVLIAHRHLPVSPSAASINGRSPSPSPQPPSLGLAPDAEGGIRIPTLRIDLLKSDPPRTVYPNNVRPIRMENDCFEGYISFYIRTDPLLPQHRAVFEGRPRKVGG